jgi:ribonucleotide monophosphatase NagD (HAD superfamily)
MGLDKSEVVMVGDKVASDIRGARDHGLRSVLVKTGEFRAGDLNGAVQPDFVFDSVADVLKLISCNENR